MSVLKKNQLFGKYEYIAVFFVILNVLVILLFTGFQKFPDTKTYISTIHWLQGKEGAVLYLHRLLRPLGLILALPFEFLGEGAGLIVQNFVFYFLVSYFFFRFVYLVFGDKRKALWGLIFFIIATPVLDFGLSYLTDTGAWFFFILSLFLTLVYLKNKNETLLMLNGFLSGVGVLMKENGGMGIIFFTMMIILSKEFTVKDKVWKIAKFGSFFFLPIIFLQYIMYKYFDFTYIDWYLYNKTKYLDRMGVLELGLRHLYSFVISLGIFTWPLILVGLWQEYQEKNAKRIRLYLALLPSSFSFLLWPITDTRFVFIFAALGVLWLVNGVHYILYKIKGRAGLIIISMWVLMTIVANYMQILFFDILLKSILVKWDFL